MGNQKQSLTPLRRFSEHVRGPVHADVEVRLGRVVEEEAVAVSGAIRGIGIGLDQERYGAIERLGRVEGARLGDRKRGVELNV